MSTHPKLINNLLHIYTQYFSSSILIVNHLCRPTLHVDLTLLVIPCKIWALWIHNVEIIVTYCFNPIVNHP